MDKTDLQYGDRVAVTKDQVSYGSKRVLAAAGREGTVVSAGWVHGYTSVRLDGNVKCTDVLTSDLKLVEVNKAVRKKNEEWQQKQIARMMELNLQLGDVVYVAQGFHHRSSVRVYVTKVLENGIYGYRVKKNGERYAGNLGIENFFSALTITRNEIKAQKNSHYVEGMICCEHQINRDVITAVGKVVKQTTRTFHVEWGHPPHTRTEIYSINHAGIAPMESQELQRRLEKGQRLTQSAAYTLGFLAFSITGATITA